MIETLSKPSKSSGKSSYSSTAANDKIANNMVSYKYHGCGERDNNEHVEGKVDLIRAEKVNNPTSVKTIKAFLAPTASVGSHRDAKPVFHDEILILECKKCWYYSSNISDLLAHEQLHVQRGALYNCSKCVFNVTNAVILYHHYRYGHMTVAPEILYPEDSVVLAGLHNMITKNAYDKQKKRLTNLTNADKITGLLTVWHYRKENVPRFTKVFKCQYCPYTDPCQHRVAWHEKMHSNLSDNQHHRQMQLRLPGCTIPPPHLYPCKRCTYVCNNAGVLASHVKVHSTSYSCSTVGFYDVTIVDSAQIRTLEYVLELEKSLLLDNKTDTNKSQEIDTKYTEIDNPELKFCPYCPALYFFRSDLQFHIQFHRIQGWRYVCDCCSFVARSKSHVAKHEVVHYDEYALHTNELLASEYPVNPKYPQPSEYPASASDDSFPWLQRQSRSPPQLQNYDDSKPHSPEPASQSQRRTERVLYSDPSGTTASQTPSIKYADDSKQLHDSLTNGVTMKTNSAKPPPLALLPQPKTTNSKSLPLSVERFRCRRCDYSTNTYGGLVEHETIHRDLPARKKVKAKTSEKLKALSNLKRKDKIPLPVILSEIPETPAAQEQPSDATDYNDK